MMLRYVGEDGRLYRDGLKNGEKYDISVATVDGMVQVIYWTGSCRIALDYWSFKDMFMEWQEV